MAQNVRARTPEEEAAARREEGELRTQTPVEEFRAQLEQLQWNAREEYLSAGDSPLDWDDLEREIAERRGGVSEEVVTDAGERSPTLEEEFQPRTPLGRRLWELRKQIVASGEPLLDEDGIEREVAERRGGARDDDL